MIRKQPATIGDNSAPDSFGQLRAFIERIMRLKEEQDTISGDIREVYAEAKGSGFDKTAMGQLVAYLRKKDKDPDKVAEQSAIFDLYLEAYERPSRTHAHEGATIGGHAETQNSHLVGRPGEGQRLGAVAAPASEPESVAIGSGTIPPSSEPTSSPAETKAADAPPPASAADHSEPAGLVEAAI